MSAGTSAWIPALQISIAIAGPILVAVVAGIISYYMWRKQQLAKQRHDLALKAIHHVILMREEFWRARAMLMDSDEVGIYQKELGHELIECNQYDVKSQEAFRRVGYTGRYNRLAKAYSSLHTVFYEVEALFGDDFREALKPIWRYIVEYRSSVELILDQNTVENLPRSKVLEHRSKMSGHPDLGRDIFGRQFEEEVKQLTNRLRPYLIRK